MGINDVPGGNPLDEIKRNKVVKKEGNDAAYQEKLDKVHAELLNLKSYQEQINSLKKQKADIEAALATTGDEEIEAKRGELESYLEQLSKSLEPLERKLTFLSRVKTYEDYGSDCDIYIQKVDQIIRELDGKISDDTLLVKDIHYKCWYFFKNQEGARRGSLSSNDIFPGRVYFDKVKELPSEYSEQMFRVGEDVEVGKPYKWKEAMELTKKYYASEKVGYYDAVKREIAERKEDEM